jgi:glycosyltransferase involved in cell wall biosynthesis
MQPFAAAGVSVLVPVHNEAQAVQAVLTQLVVVMQSLAYPAEILAIDDGSTDTSLQQITEIADPKLRVIRHATNWGYGASLSHGVQQARFPSLIITDADSTSPLERLPDLLAGLDQHAMVVGVRTGAAARAMTLRRPVKWVLRKAAERMTGQSIPDLNAGFRAIRREAVLPLLPVLPDRFSWTSTITVVLLLRKQPVAFLPIRDTPRQGRSKFHPFCDTLRTIRCLLRAALFSRPPSVQDEP